MNGLPSGLTEPLHIDSPFPWWLLLVVLMAAVTALAVWFRRRRVATAEPPPPSAPARPVSIFGAIAELKARYDAGDSFRRACHELSRLLRSHFERGSRHSFSTLTSREIGRAVGDTALSRFFALLADVQFRRREPTKNDFHGLCDVAAEVARKRGGAR